MLKVSQNKRFLCKDEKFFPYLADTAWTLLQRLTRKEILYYLDKRSSQGFNAVQVSAISELDGLRTPNKEGFLPFVNMDVSRPSEEYFSLLFFLADECEKRGMVLVLLPTWGDKFNKKWGIGPEVFNPQNAYGYGAFLARLVGKRENIIWMLGGDRPIETKMHKTIIDRLAEGLRAGECVYHLMTYHPCGEASSADFVGRKAYIDFHTVQSSHSFGGFESELMLRRTLEKEKKPCIDSECFYEDFPIDFNTEWGYRLCDRDIRRRIYKNMIAGAFGHTYGHQSVWCFKNESDAEYIYGWRDALDRPMAGQMKNINLLSEIVDFTTIRQEKVCCNANGCVGDGFILIYTENCEPFFIDPLKKYSISSGLWFNPVDGTCVEAAVNPNHNTASSPFGHDAVLILYY